MYIAICSYINISGYITLDTKTACSGPDCLIEDSNSNFAIAINYRFKILNKTWPEFSYI